MTRRTVRVVRVLRQALIRRREPYVRALISGAYAESAKGDESGRQPQIDR